MRYQELYDALHRQPFEPFRLLLTNGDALVVQHPDFAGLLRSSLLLFVSSERDEVPDRLNQYDLLHIVKIEPVTGLQRQRQRRPKRRGP